MSLASTSRRGCSRKAASRDTPAGLWAGKPESRTGSGRGCPARWLTGRAANHPGSWQAPPAVLGRKRQKRGACTPGWGWPGWRLIEPWEEKKKKKKSEVLLPFADQMQSYSVRRERVQVDYFGTWGVTNAATGTRVRARMKPREKLMRAVQPSSTARYSTATSFSPFQPCSVPSPDRSLQQTAGQTAHSPASQRSFATISASSVLPCQESFIK